MSHHHPIKLQQMVLVGTCAPSYLFDRPRPNRLAQNPKNYSDRDGLNGCFTPFVRLKMLKILQILYFFRTLCIIVHL